MSLSDLMSHAGLAGFAEVAMALFMAAFVVIAVRLFWPGRRRELDSASRLPLEDDVVDSSRSGAKS